MINKKVFALTLIASGVIAAGCSSDDDDDPMTDPVVNECSADVGCDAQSTDVNGDGTINDDDDINGDGVVNDLDVTAFGGGPLVDNTTDAVTPDADSTDVDGDGSLTDADDLDGDGDIDQDDVDMFAQSGGGGGPVMADLPAGSEYVAPVEATLNLAEVATTAGLNSLVSQAGNCPDINAALADADARLTVFAPNDDAFTAANDALNGATQEEVCDILAGHILNDTVADSTVLAANVGTSATTLAGTTVAIEAGAEAGTLMIGGVPIIGADSFATNGVAHVISGVILPMEDGGDGDDNGDGGGDGTAGPVATAFGAAPDVSEFEAVFNSSGFSSALDGVGGDGNPNTWTVFAPSNAALSEASVNAADLQTADLQRHIHTNASLSESELGAMSSITMTSGLGTYDVAMDADGGITVGGFPVTLITSGQSTVYQIEGVLPAAAQ